MEKDTLINKNFKEMKPIVDFLNESLNEGRFDAESEKFQVPTWYTKEVVPFAEALKNGLKRLPKEFKPYEEILSEYITFIIQLPEQAFQDDDYLKKKSNLYDFMHEDFFDNYDFDEDLAEQFQAEEVWEKYYKTIAKKDWKW